LFRQAVEEESKSNFKWWLTVDSRLAEDKAILNKGHSNWELKFLRDL
jgi:hypothetical protein